MPTQRIPRWNRDVWLRLEIPERHYCPTGDTTFEFKAGDLYFHSTGYEWLVLTGSDYAKLKGSGTISGAGDYKFMLWAGDGVPHTFRIRIWEEVEETGEEIVIYDNGVDQTITGGSIVIHTK